MKGKATQDPLSLHGKKVILTGSTAWYLYNFRKGTILALKEHGASVFCIAPEDGYANRLECELGAEFRAWRLDRTSANPVTELKTLWQLFRLFRSIGPDFVFNFTVKPNIYAGLCCRFLRIPYANNVTGLGMKIGSKTLLSKVMSRLYGFSNRGAKRVFVQNPDDLKYLRDNGLIGQTPVTELAGSGVDLNHFSAEDVAPPPRTFVMIARLEADKGVRDFVAAARLVKQKYPETRFALVGASEFTNQTAIPEAELSSWRQEGIVELAGHADDVRPWLKAAHAIVLPSHGGEGTPRVILEAAASGRPCIVSDVPGCRHAVIDGKTGLIYPARDVDALAGCMEKIIQMTEESITTMGRNARRLAEERFSVTQVVRIYLACLAEQFQCSSPYLRS